MKIATHNGRFHADDAFAIATLKLIGLVGELVRTRDETVMADCDLRVDVGRKNNPDTGDFDHHQPGGGERPNGIPYASFGLIWKQYGVQAAGSQEAAAIVDARLVQKIDTDDAGKVIFESLVEDVTPYTFDHLITLFNPSWLTEPSEQEMDKAFDAAVLFVTEVLKKEIDGAKVQIEAAKKVRDAITGANGGPVIVLDHYAPWQEVVIHEAPQALYIVYPVWPAREHDWSVQAVPKKVGVIGNRKDLPNTWGGKVGAELAAASGVPDAIFCHTARFLVVAKSKEGALALAKKAVEA